MKRLCDNTSVGVLVTNPDNELLLLSRAKFPYGLAAPAGHIDEHGRPEQAAINEVYEEVGLRIGVDSLVHVIRDRRIDNQCRRPKGNYHVWNVYKTTVDDSEIMPSADETRGAAWYSSPKLKEIIRLTRASRAEPQPSEELLEGVWLDFIDEVGVDVE